MVFPIAIPLAVWGLLRLIAWMAGGVLITSYVRDVANKVLDYEIKVETNDTIEEILDQELPDEKKENLILEYLDLPAPDAGLEKWLPVAAVGLGLAFLLGGRR